MAEAKADNLIRADDEIEGEREPTEDFVFVRIGDSLPLKASDSAFDLQNPPSQPLAISQRHRLLFLVHSEGFFVAKTDDVVESAKDIKKKGRGPSVEGASIMDVKIGRVSILSLSEDEETLAAAVGGEIFFFSTLSLLKKVQDPSFFCSVANSGMVKDFKWQKNIDKSFLVLSSHGSLHHGTMQAQLKAVMGDVDAVDWSRDGIFVAVARKHTITILSANFKEVLSLSLFFESWAPTDSECTIKVDSIKWVRDDSIIMGSFQVNEDGEEEGYLIQIITSKEKKFSEVSCQPIIYSFPDIFDGVWDVLPNGCGPYLIATLLDYWEIVLASNQKTIDQHILLFKWSKDNRREVLLLDIINDKYKPKIDLQENGDDNLLLGLAVDKFSSSEKIIIQTGATEFKVLPSRCTLLCLTSEGKLILYHAARISEPSDLPEKLSSLDDDNSDVKGKHSMPSSSEQSATRLELEEDVDGATSDYRLKQINIEPLNSHEGLFKLGGETISPKRRQDGGVSQVGYFTGQIGHLNKSSAEAPIIPQPGLGKRAGSGSGIHMFSKPSARVESSTSLTASKTSETATATHMNAKNGESRDLGEGIFRPNITTAPSGSQTTGKLFGTDFFSPQRSTFSSSVPVSNFQEKNNFTSEFQSSNLSFSSRGLTKQPASPMFSSRQTTPNSWLKAGDAELTSTAPSSVVHAQEGHLPGKMNYSTASSLFENISISKLPQALNSEPEISKQFYNVKNMAQELDILLSSIEKEGGFRDACTKFQKSSLLALENGLEALSDRSRECKKNVEEQLVAIQQLQNKMMQVSARQVYMKGIVEQASDRKYWEIWNRQKLNPELEAKWKNILNANQNLTDHIIELERHFNTLEINRFGGSGKISQGQSVSQSGYLSSRQNQSLQSVYTTLNSQLTAAQHLSRCLSEQMSELNINSPPLKIQSKKKELFESIGLSPETTALESPDFRRLVLTPDSVRRTPPSTTSSIWKGASSTVKAPEPETGRRRRDSLDRNWTTFEPPKTTVKRTVQKKSSRVSADEPFRKAKHVYNSQLEAFTMQQKRNAANIPSFQYILSEGMQDSMSKQAVVALPNSFSGLSRDISNSSEISGSISHPMAGKQRTGSLPPSMPQTLSTFSSFSSSTKVVSGSPDISSRNATKARNISDSSAAKTVSSSSITSNKQFEASNSVESSFKFGGSFSLMNTRTVEAKDKTIKNTNPDERTLPARPLNTFSPQSISVANERNTTSVSPSTTFTLSGLDTVQLNKSTRSSQSSESVTNLQSPSPSVPFSFSTSPAAASSKTFLTPASKATICFVKSSLSSEPAGITNQTDSVPTSTSASDNHSLPSSSTISSELQNSVSPTSRAVTPTKTFGTSSSSVDAKRKELNQMASVPLSTSAASSSNQSLSSSVGRFSQSQKLSSVSTPVSASLHSPTGSDPTAPVTSASPDSVKLDKAISQSQPASTQSSVPELAECMPQKEDNLIGKVGDNMTLPKSNSQPETPSSTVPLTSGTTTEKDGVLDGSLSQEDEMEEEAPDTTAVLSLGSLSGFGFGSTPTAPKTNPFGGSFLTASSTAASSPVSFPASSPGEPFRPASFTLPSAQPVQPSQLASSGGFSGGFGGGFSGFGQPSQVGVGQPAQAGAGQQALGSVLGSFGQSRQLGTVMQGGGFPSSSAFGGGGFSAAGGFATAGTGGFASVGSAGGGFAAAGKGGGFAAVSTSGGFAGAGAGGGFSSVSPAGGFGAVGGGGGFGAAATGSGGFGAAATGGGGFGAPATGSGGFAAAATGGGFASGGFAAFGSGQGGGGFSAFGGNSSSGAGKPPAELLTQMRK